MAKGGYHVFVSHTRDDRWVAGQIAKNIEACGAPTFLDRRDNFGNKADPRIREEIKKCDELLALLTPWSFRKDWLRHEIGMADGHDKKIVCVFYNVTKADLRADGDGPGPWDGFPPIEINDLDTYFEDLRRRLG